MSLRCDPPVGSFVLPGGVVFRVAGAGHAVEARITAAAAPGEFCLSELPVPMYSYTSEPVAAEGGASADAEPLRTVNDAIKEWM